MLTPAPPNRPCARYSTKGSRCTNRTSRADGWCGECDGYTTEATIDHGEDQPRRSEWRWGPGPWLSATLEMDSDEAYEIDVAPGATAAYVRVHGVTPQIAETQIRSLLEDLITGQAVTEKNGGGAWRIYFRKYGYGLMVSPDRAHVLRYCTAHMERTWAQYRAGVVSRITNRHSGMPAWKRDAIDRHAPLPVAEGAANLYARHVLGIKATRETIDGIAEHLGARLREHVMPKWRRGEAEAIDDTRGSIWHLVCNDRHPDGMVVAMHAPTPPAPEES